jgi:hypothetical protein
LEENGARLNRRRLSDAYRLACALANRCPPQSQSQSQIRPRAGATQDTVILVLASAQRPLRAREIHAAAEKLAGTALSWNTVKDCLHQARPATPQPDRARQSWELPARLNQLHRSRCCRYWPVPGSRVQGAEASAVTAVANGVAVFHERISPRPPIACTATRSRRRLEKDQSAGALRSSARPVPRADLAAAYGLAEARGARRRTWAANATSCRSRRSPARRGCRRAGRPPGGSGSARPHAPPGRAAGSARPPCGRPRSPRPGGR